MKKRDESKTGVSQTEDLKDEVGVYSEREKDVKDVGSRELEREGRKSSTSGDSKSMGNCRCKGQRTMAGRSVDGKQIYNWYQLPQEGGNT